MSDQPRNIRTSSRSGIRDSVLGTRNLMTIAALSVVGSILVVPLSIFTPAFATTPRTLIILCAIMGTWYVAYLLPGIFVRKPGVFVLAGLLIGIISSFTTPLGPSAIVGNVLGAVFLEIPMLVFLYRKWTWWTYAIGATIFASFNAGLYGTAYNIPQSSTEFISGIVCSLASCYVTLALALLLRRSLARAGVGIHQ